MVTSVAPSSLRTGPPGTGKTRRSIYVAEQVLNRFEHGVRFVALEAAREPNAMIAAVARALDMRGERKAPVPPLAFLNPMRADDLD
jgi:predicted ATPase